MKLTKPIQAHNETLTELNFREPKGAEITRNGFPFKYFQNGGVQERMFDTAAVARWISDLAAIPPSSVAQLSVLDFTRAMGEIVGFFADTEIQSTS